MDNVKNNSSKNEKNYTESDTKNKETRQRDYNKIIYPHIDNSQQRKTTKYIFCYYANVVDLRRFNDEGFSKFNNQLISFIMKSNYDKLIGPEEVYNSKTRNLRKHFTRTDGELSCFWEYMYINKDQKNTVDKFLIEVLLDNNLFYFKIYLLKTSYILEYKINYLIYFRQDIH